MDSHPVQPLAILAAVLALAGAAALGLELRARGSVPAWLATKVAFETGYAQTQAPDLTRCANEVATLEKRRADAPKDEKGNPILPEEVPPAPATASPADYTGVFEDTAPAYFHGAMRERYAFTTLAIAPYDVLVAASEREDEGAGILFHFRMGLSDGIVREDHRFPGKGPIVLEALADDENVVTFRWGDGQQGYFDLRTGTAAFSPYTTP